MCRSIRSHCRVHLTPSSHSSRRWCWDHLLREPQPQHRMWCSTMLVFYVGLSGAMDPRLLQLQALVLCRYLTTRVSTSLATTTLLPMGPMLFRYYSPEVIY